MSEIRFACPHCQQHIACDPGYVDMCIVCPGCGKPMVVPVLSASETAHAGTCIVASIPTPKRRLTSRVPTIDVWGREEWAEHLQAVDQTASPPMPLWALSALVTLILAVFLRALAAQPWMIFACVALGTILSVVLFLKGGTMKSSSSIYQVLGWVLLLIVAIPALAVGVLFIGCCVAG